jgi:broad specificity phosphatase PhoE
MKMKNKTLIFLLTASLFSCTRSVYIVRHAEKSLQPANDPVLSVEGQQRSEALAKELGEKKITKIYSTNTTRTLSTVSSLGKQLNITTEIYLSRPDSVFITRVRSFKSNVLIVGHSNTVDDIVNMLAGKTLVEGDLPDTMYDNLYHLTLHKRTGAFIRFSNKKYGESSIK